jgi:RND family efflux transporter MFP subunit
MSEPNKRSPVAFLIGLLLGALTAAILAYALFYATHTVQKDARLVGLPVPVQAVDATVKVLREAIGASGVIQPSMPVILTAKVISRVLRVPFDLGAVVKPGDVLVELDPRLYQANLESARINYDHAHRQVQRLEALMKKNYAAASDLEKARAEEAMAYDAVVRAEIDLANTRITSPVPGVVLERVVNPGEITRLDQQMIELGVLNPVMMVAQVSEDKIGAVYLGMKGVVATDAFPGVDFRGTVAKIDSRVNDATRTFATYIQLANNDLRLRKGVTGYARLESTKMALAVPSTAVMNPLGDHASVFIVGSDHRAHLRAIRPGMAVDGMIEILGGLDEHEQVVAAGQYDLRDNDPVSVNRFAPWNN